jgi:hypothetical protein
MPGGGIHFKATVFINEREMLVEERETAKKEGRISTELARSIVQRTLGEVFVVESIAIGLTTYEE